ncbi:MAG TPA: lysophospholipid acyltransferase family protein [Steroidobacteraceae bacterium]|nr:lysophospholipid acyltransferase family protein [Steroidobacteraceae bacterium]
MRSDAYWWRWLATGLCFAVFGAASLGLGLAVLPLLRLTAAPAKGRLRVRRVLAAAVRAYLRLLPVLGVLSWEFTGAERLGRPGQLILANHPTLIDVLFLLGFAPGASCVVKGSLWRNPFTRWPLLAAGYVPNAPTGLMIGEATAALAAGQSVIIFPEGTRTVPGAALSFHRGAAAIAIRAAAVVTPVYIRCDPPTLTKREPWYRIPPRRVHFSLRTGADIDVTGLRARASGPLAARELNARLLDAYVRELAGP